MAFISTNVNNLLAMDICKALGLPGKTTSLDLHFKVGELATVKWAGFMQCEPGSFPVESFKDYYLVDKSDEDSFHGPK